QLMNDPGVTVGSELLVSPVDFMVEAPLEYDARQAIVTAVTERPEVSQALLALDDAAIGVSVADNLRLPLLNFTARMEYVGLDDALSGSYQNAFDNSFIDYVVGLAFEQPIGNRAAEAGYRQSRLRQSAAAIAYRQTVQNIVQDVKNALRDVVANYELIQATRSFRLAQTENLRTLLVEEEFKAGLTPEFLNLKFQRQDTLATAELQELEALANFNKAVARLYRAMGVGMSMNGITFGQ
ncbi:MAG: TolC family protein, partial [Phycisphaerales bacterium]|nr:TolC family protein [Phycisphaerales bacterium]